MKVFFFTLFCFIFLIAQHAGARSEHNQCPHKPFPKGNRQFGMDILNTLQRSPYEKNLERLLQLGGSYQHFSMNWSAIEPRKGQLQDPNTYLSMMNAVAMSSQTKITFILRPIDTTRKTVPSDLSHHNFNDPEMIARFQKMLDFTLTKITPDHLVDIMIGNEVDTFNPNGDENFWVEYAQFLSAIKSYANKHYPGIDIGFVGTFNGLTDPNQKTADGWPAQKVLQTFAEMVNVVGVTYYPLNSDFSVQSPSIVSKDFALLKQSVLKNVPIHMTEVGYPSSSENGSDVSRQAAFYCEFMHAWDLSAKRIPYISTLRMNDIPKNQAAGMAGSYGIGSSAFVEYLRTLGVVDDEGKEKPAYKMLQHELQKRKF